MKQTVKKAKMHPVNPHHMHKRHAHSFQHTCVSVCSITQQQLGRFSRKAEIFGSVTVQFRIAKMEKRDFRLLNGGERTS